MAHEIVMPNLGFDAENATLLEWLKQPGDDVQRGEPIAIVESDKAEVELEALADGVMLQHTAVAGETVPIGAVIGTIGQMSERVIAADTPVAEVRPVESGNRVTPIAQRIANEHDVDLSQVSGTGSGGKITRRDVEAHVQIQQVNGISNGSVQALPKVRKAARERGIDLADLLKDGYSNPISFADLEAFDQPSQPVEQPTEVIANRDGVDEITQSRMRQTIGRRLAASMQDAPHFYVSGEFDLEPALSRLNEMPGDASLNELIQYLSVQTLLQVPALNATYENQRLFHHKRVNLAIAVALDDGLITPVIPDAHRYSLVGLAEVSREVIHRARNKRLQPDDLQPGTFTISNLGVIKAVDHFTAVINPPQVAILAVGRIKQRPKVIDGGLHIRHTVHLTLSGDHRAVDGIHLGQFLNAFQIELDQFSK